MASTSFIVNSGTGDSVDVKVTITEVAGGDLQVTLEVVNGDVADLRGFFFNLSDDTLLTTGNIHITGTNVNGFVIDTDGNGTPDVDKAAPPSPQADIDPYSFEAGVELGTPGIGIDDIGSTTFTISADSRDLTLADIIGQQVGVRLQAVWIDANNDGIVDAGERDGSSKLIGTVPDISTDDGVPVIHIEKTAGVASIDEGTATDITYTYVITANNTSTDPITITSLVDDHGTTGTGDDIDLLARLAAKTATLDGDKNGNGTLDAGETWTITTKIGSGIHDFGDDLTNIVNVSGEDDEGNKTSDDDDATVTINDLKPVIHIEKTTEVTSIDEGTATNIKYHYEISANNTSTDPITITDLVDDNGTPLDNTDDVDLLALIKNGDITLTGDANEDFILDSGETWSFDWTAEGVVRNAKDGSLTNIVTVTGQDDEENSTSDDDDATVTVTDKLPDIKVVKTVDADGDGSFHSSETVQAGKVNATYKYVVTNESTNSTDPITLDSLSDNKVPGLSLANYKSGDSNSNGLLDVGEKWIFKVDATFTLQPKSDSLTNTVTVVGHDDEDNSVNDTDTATVSSFAGPGVRTPGFWANNGLQFWDGDLKTIKTGPYFPGELLPGGAKCLILGGDHDNVLEAGELKISLADAVALLNASTKQQQDGRWMLGRDVVAAELNIRAGNPETDGDTSTLDPQHVLQDAVDWILKFQAVKDQTLSLSTDFTAITKIGTSTDGWNKPQLLNDPHSAAFLHNVLDEYNNNGSILGHIFANDGDGAII